MTRPPNVYVYCLYKPLSPVYSIKWFSTPQRKHKRKYKQVQGDHAECFYVVTFDFFSLCPTVAQRYNTQTQVEIHKIQVEVHEHKYKYTKHK